MKIIIAILLLTATTAFAADVAASYQVTPADLAKQIESGQSPLILNVGPQKLYDQAHIRGAEFMGAGSTEEGRAKLRARVKSLPKNTAIVLYCGCCPWERCPNINPAFAELQKLRFSNVKVMYVAHNIGADWVDQGYPTEKGK